MSRETQTWSLINSRYVATPFLSQLRAYPAHSGFASRTAPLDRRGDSDPRIGHLSVYLHLLYKTFSNGMLCSTHHQFGLLHGDGAGMLSHMPPFRLQLGSIFARNLWGSEILGFVYWGLQLVDGRCDSCIANARLMGAADAGWEEGCY